MRLLALLLYLIIFSPAELLAQSSGELLQKVSDALLANKNDHAVSLFQQAVEVDINQAEMFYCIRMDKHTVVVQRFALELATGYKDVRNYDKAYLFYKEFLQYHPDDVSALVSCAEMEVMRGKETDASELYKKVLKLDINNLPANIFLGNYYFLQAEQDKKKVEDEYRRIISPTRMQYARYRNALSDIFSTGYVKAREYLQRVLRVFPSTGADRILKKIKEIEEEINRS